MSLSNASDDESHPPVTTAKLSLPLKTRIPLSIYTHVTDYARRPDGTINRAFLDFLDLKSPPNPLTVDGVSTSDVSVDPDRNLWFRIFTPVDDATASATTSSSLLPVIVYFHGGGFYCLGASSKNLDAFGRRYARDLRAVFVSVNYRLTPEHRFPSQYDDGIDALRFLDSNPKMLPSNADLTKTFLCGDSAGGNIAHHVTVRACQNPLENMKLVGLILLQPFFGGEERTESEIRLANAPLLSIQKTDWCWKAFIPDGDRDHWAINVSGPNAIDLASVEGFPDTLVAIGGYDMLRDWQWRYYKWLQRCGKWAELLDYPGACHSFYAFQDLPESQQLVSEIRGFVSRRCK